VAEKVNIMNHKLVK